MKKDVDKLIIQFINLENFLSDVASSDDISLKHIKKLSRILSSSGIITGIALNKKTPSYILEYLFDFFSGSIGGTDSETRRHIVFNPSLDMKFLKTVSETDIDPYVREGALYAIKLRTEDVKGLYENQCDDDA